MSRVHVYIFFLFLGDKFLLRWYRGYLITATEGGRMGGARGGGGGGSKESKTLTIYDMQNQFIGNDEFFVSVLIYCTCYSLFIHTHTHSLSLSLSLQLTRPHLTHV